VAVRHFRKHAAKHPDENCRLAWALETQSDLLTEQGKHEDALAVDRETVEIWRRAVAIEKGYTIHLSRSLNRIALTLGRLDREAESAPHTTESIALTRLMIAGHERSLALLLSNLTISLIDAEEWDRALPVAEEAWEIRRRLAAMDPGLRDVAVGDADQLRKILQRLERPAQILRVSEEVVEYERALLADDPSRLPEFAFAVRTLGKDLVAEGRVPEGKARWYESLELLRRFSETNKDGRSAYAGACESVGHSLGALRHDEESLAVLRDGLAVRRALAASDTRHHEELVRALGSAALRLNWSEQPDLARQFAAEGLALYRKHPDSSGPPQVQQTLQELAEDPTPGTAQEP
jgi:tetratricopeptide (TPR) repeat protein